MESESSDNDQSSYDVFHQNSVETLEVIEQKPFTSPPDELKMKPVRRFKFTKRLILLVVVILILIGGGLVGYKLFKKSVKKPPPTVVINTQSLDNGTLNQLESTAGGNSQQQLSISPTTLFKNNATVQGSLEIAKNLSVGGAVNIQGGTNIKDSLAVGKTLSVGNNLTVSGLITAASLSVGSITISSINISGDLVFGGHIIPSGSQPSARASTAAAGGSVFISGNDSAGTIMITTGSRTISPGNPLTAGEMAIITFNKAFSTTPKVQLTPVSSEASDLRYFATHSAGFFTINTSSSPTANTTYSFDYLVTQ